MSVETIIKHRTQEKEIRLSGELVMTKEQWEKRGGVYRGSLGTAAKSGWYTIRSCELMGEPITEDELKNCNDFAMFKDCYQDYCIRVDNGTFRGKYVRPCLPVFYRIPKEQKQC